ncbi:hypothetical protein CAL7716_017830 [Calothrix sp. PCC 7716]|nr:hypothetical protein CAL7716_017830 [Calothrix sp. PCC 7716]
MALNLPKIPSWLKISIASIGTVTAFAFEGIIGNTAHDALKYASPFLNISITVRLWVAILCVFFVVFPCLLVIQRYHAAHQISVKLHSLDETLWYLLPKLCEAPDASLALQRFFDEFLEQTLEFLQLLDGCGIAVYAPDVTDPDYLTTWFFLEYPNESPDKARFYIGNGSNAKRGIAGLTFLDKKSYVVHLSRKNGELQADNPEYIFFDKAKRRRFPYKSLITVPIIGDTGDCLGVMCLYSNYVTAFDSSAVKNLLVAISGRLSTAMLVAKAHHMHPLLP